ncbi:Putative metallopeptidase domain protein [uncultured archaeon]|nr:Putative metallopeptidase domain protein [uncultured archaeon]
MNTTTATPTSVGGEILPGVLGKLKSQDITNGPIPRELHHHVEDKIVQARVKMLFKHPFFGALAVRREMFPADGWLPTMAVDYKYLYYNHAFVDRLTIEELVFVFSHEMYHLVYDHLGRGEGLDRNLYNCAADYVVNAELVDSKIGEMPVNKKTKEPTCLYDKKYAGWASEKVYDDLKKKTDKMTLDQLVDKLLDVHLRQSQNDGDGNGKPGPNGPASISKEERKRLRNQLKQEIISAAQMSGIGNLPAGIQRLVGNLVSPRMDWKTLIQTQLASLIPADYSFQRVNRKGWDIDAILPGQIEEQMIDLAIYLDMSGSITDPMVRDFLSEVKGIMDQYPMHKIRIGCFDTNVYNEKIFESDNGDDIRTYAPKGGGGSDASCIFTHLKKEHVIPLKAIIFTDGFLSSFGDAHYCPTLWIIAGSDVIPPWGMHAYYDKKKD